MATQTIYVFQPEDYQGELNLNALERRIIVRELKRTQRFNKAVALLGFTTKSLERKLVDIKLKKKNGKL